MRQLAVSRLLFSTCVAAALACGTPSPPPAAPPPPPAPAKVDEVVYVQASNLNLRGQGSPQAPVVGRLPINTPVRLTGSPRAGDWVEVTTPWGQRGWVHQGYTAAEVLTLDALRQTLAELTDPTLRLAVVQRMAALSPRDPAVLQALAEAYRAAGDPATGALVERRMAEGGDTFESWFPAQFEEVDAVTAALPQARDARTLIALWERALVVSQDLAEPLNAIIFEGDDIVFDARREAVVEARVPWGQLLAYAEGTHAVVELSSSTWAEAATRTPELWDDAFLALVIRSYDNASGRGWAAWQQRSWDYGGCSPLGNGQDLHLQLLLATDGLQGHPAIAEHVARLRREILADIEQPQGPGEFPYCRDEGGLTPVEGLQGEAERILAQVKLAPEERAMIEARVRGHFMPRAAE